MNRLILWAARALSWLLGATTVHGAAVFAGHHGQELPSKDPLGPWASLERGEILQEAGECSSEGQEPFLSPCPAQGVLSS